MRRRRAHLTCVFRISHFGHFAFRGAKPDTPHFAARNRTLRISRRETGHFRMAKYQIDGGARHSLRVPGARHPLRVSGAAKTAKQIRYVIVSL